MSAHRFEGGASRSSCTPTAASLKPLLRLDTLDEPLEDRTERLLETIDLDLGLLDVLVERERLGQSGKGRCACVASRSMRAPSRRACPPQRMS